MSKPCKLLICSDIHHFSTLDCYTGIVNGMKQIGVNFDVADLRSLVDKNNIMCLSLDAALGLVFAKAANVENEFTHVMFVSGLVIPEWMFKSLRNAGLKTIVWSLDCPHSSRQLYEMKPLFDYWFSNEKKMEMELLKIFYVPTATDSTFPTIDRSKIDEKYINDVVFIGTIYPDRVKPLEDAIVWCEENGKKIKIIGPVLNTPKNSIVHKYAENRLITNQETKIYYCGSKVVLNLDRDVNWNCNEESGNSQLVGDGKPYSSNPRLYETALCKSVQLYANARPEARDIFGDNIYTSTNDNVKEVLDIIFKEDESVLQTKINTCFDIVRNNHLYLHRASKIINILERY